MTLATTKSHLIELLADDENKVIALSGKWGTGKSYMWREAQKESMNILVQRALYVSLFGVSDMTQFKMKVMQSAIPGVEHHKAAFDAMNSVAKGTLKIAKTFFSGASAVDELVALAVPVVLTKKFIVIDDIERKHEKLSVDEVLGFIDEYTQLYGARMLLILNSDQLQDKGTWDKLREKVIDQELLLDTSPTEAFNIALKATPSSFSDQARKASEACGLTNIRIVQKVLRAINRILGGHLRLPEMVLERLIPSTVLLAATHYKGIDDGPDFNFILHIGDPDFGSFDASKDDAKGAIAQLEAKWKLLLSRLGVVGCDEYELLVVEYLRSGLLDGTAVGTIVDRYANEAELMTAMAQSRQFQEHVIWHHEMSDADLVAEAKELCRNAHRLDPYAVTALHDLISSLEGGKAVANEIVENWIADFRSKNQRGFDDSNFFNRKLDIRIAAAFDNVKASERSEISVFAALYKVAKNQGWGAVEEGVLKSATIEDFRQTIFALPANELKIFLLKFMELTESRSNYDQHFGSAISHFIEACRMICTDSQSPRLGKLIRNVFSNAKLQGALEKENAD